MSEHIKPPLEPSIDYYEQLATNISKQLKIEKPDYRDKDFMMFIYKWQPVYESSLRFHQYLFGR